MKSPDEKWEQFLLKWDLCLDTTTFSVAIGGWLGFPGTLDEAASREKNEGASEPKVKIVRRK